MNFCQHCGSHLEGSKKFCPACGCAVAGSSAVKQSNNYSQSYAQHQNQYNHPGHGQGPYPGQPNNQTGHISQIQNDNVMLMSVLAYIFVLIPLLTGAHKTSEVIKYHTNQGTVLLIVGIVWGIIRAFLGIAIAYVPYFTWALANLLNLVWIGFAALCIVGILNAINNRMKPLPVIGGFTIIK